VSAHRRQWSASNPPQIVAQAEQMSEQTPHSAGWKGLLRSIRLTHEVQTVAQSRQVLAQSVMSGMPIHWSAQYSHA